jgi:hypothetical protein
MSSQVRWETVARWVEMEKFSIFRSPPFTAETLAADATRLVRLLFFNKILF